MRSLLLATAALEGPTGIALLAWPPLPMTVLIWALLTCNIATAAVLAHRVIAYGSTSPGLWPVVAAHAALAIWCVAGLASPAARNGVGNPAP